MRQPGLGRGDRADHHAHRSFLRSVTRPVSANVYRFPVSFAGSGALGEFVEEDDLAADLRVRKGIQRLQARRFHDVRLVVSNLGVFDFDTPDHAMRIRSVHPGVDVNDVVSATGFALVVPDPVPITPAPTADELELIREVLDPTRLRDKEIPS